LTLLDFVFHRSNYLFNRSNLYSSRKLESLYFTLPLLN